MLRSMFALSLINILCVCVQITTVDEAKTFYPLFGLGANVALIFSGRAVKYFSQVIFASVLAEDCVCGHCLFH